MTTLSTLPAYPVPGRKVALKFGISSPGANYVRVWLTAAPTGSAKQAELEKSGEKRLHFYSGNGSAFVDFEPDKGGVYKLLAQEYTKGSSYGGAYEGDPNGAPSETKVGAELTLDLLVGQRVTQTLGYGADTATLVWWIFGDRVRATTLSTHGEATPAIIDPSSMRAMIAAEDISVLERMSAMPGQLVSGLVGDLGTLASLYATVIGGHMAMVPPVHNPTADTYNTLPAGFAASVSPQTLPDIVNRLLATLRNHMLNVDPTSGGDIGSGITHSAADQANLPIVQSVGDLAQAYAALGDMYRSYQAHRSSGVHGALDGTNNLGAVPVLVGLHRYFFSSLSKQDPVVPDTVNSGVVTAISVAGFVEG